MLSTRPSFVYVAPMTNPTGVGWSRSEVPDMASWLDHMKDYVLRYSVTLKPPKWWLEAQDGKGREKSKFQIWHNKYSLDKKLAQWAVAPVEDFIDAGYAEQR